MTSSEVNGTNGAPSIIPAHIITAAETFVKEHLNAVDPSHDWWHVDRVRKVALSIARQEQPEAQKRGETIDFGLVELAALLHDVADFKYGGTEQQQETAISSLLTDNGCPDPETIQRVTDIVKRISFRKELAASGQPQKIPIETAIVQDADKLDAIGAIGIARCMAFSGARNRPLYDPTEAAMENMTKEQYDAQSRKGGGNAINHFYEKLFRLKTMIKTDTGKRMAEERDNFMREYVERFKKEWEGVA
ncbi:hypothetical protein HK102_004285 [Quaeritorhiza haematococci]|nr:hypothetical protein HK102_004285 [Quaeritorhiza haematococci]